VRGLVETQAAHARLVPRLSALIGGTREDILAPQGLSIWSRAQRSLQPYVSWTTFEDWVERDTPRMTFTVARGLIAGSQISAADRGWAALMREEARARLAYLLPPGTILCMPTTPFAAPKRGLPVTATDTLRDRISCLAAHGGLAGFPQVSIPGATVDGAPVGLSILAARGSDATLVAVARALEQTA
jgi:amidase